MADACRGRLRRRRQARMANALSVGVTYDEEALELDVNGNVLRLFHAACKANRLERALELAQQLSRRNVMDGALAIANKMRLVELAARIGRFIQARSGAAAGSQIRSDLYQMDLHPIGSLSD